MALTAGQIQIDFNSAIQQADKLEGIADRLTKISDNKFQSAMQGIVANWKSDNASAYIRKAQLVQKKMNASVEDLYTVAGEIRAAAKRMYDAEMAALLAISTKI